MSPSPSASAKPTNKSLAADASIAALERPRPAGVNAPGFGSDVVAETLRALDIPYIAVTPGASYRGLHDSIVNYLGNADAADAAVRARGSRGRDRARLRQGDRQGDGGRRAFQCRAAARHHGDVQRLVRPHAGAGARRDRSGRRGQAPAVDRLDPHRARSGRAGARLHQVGRPAGLGQARHAKRCCAAPGSPTPRRWARSTSTSTPKCRRRSSPSRCRRSMPRATCRRSRPPRPPTCVQRSGGDAEIGQAGRDPRRPRLAQRGSLERARRARRSAQRQRRHRSQNRRELPDRSSAARRRAARRDARQRAGDPQRRRDFEPRLGRSRRRAARPRPRPGRKDHPGLARPPHPQRLEHGPSGAAAGRPFPLRRSRSRRARTGASEIGGGGKPRASPRSRRRRPPIRSRPASPTSTSRARCAKFSAIGRRR